MWKYATPLKKFIWKWSLKRMNLSIKSRQNKRLRKTHIRFILMWCFIIKCICRSFDYYSILQRHQSFAEQCHNVYAIFPNTFQPWPSYGKAWFQISSLCSFNATKFVCNWNPIFIDYLAKKRYISEGDGSSKSRAVYMTKQQYVEIYGETDFDDHD